MSWVSDDSFVYLNPAADFDLSPAQSQQLREATDRNSRRQAAGDG